MALTPQLASPLARAWKLSSSVYAFCARTNGADPGDALQSLARLVGAMLQSEPPLDRANHRMQRLQLRRQYDQARTGINGQTFISLVRNDRQQLLEPLPWLIEI